MSTVDFTTPAGFLTWLEFGIALLGGEAEKVLVLDEEAIAAFSREQMIGVKIVEAARWQMVALPEEMEEPRHRLVEALVLASISAFKYRMDEPAGLMLCKVCARAILKQNGEEIVHQLLRECDAAGKRMGAYTSFGLREVLVSLLDARHGGTSSV